MKRILIGVAAVVLVFAMLGVGSFAYFSDTGSSSGNTFTAGTLDLKLANTGGSWDDNVSSTWMSPAGWAPGDKLTADINLKNTGSVGARIVYGDFNTLTETVGGYSDHIFVTSWKDSYPWAVAQGGSGVAFGDEYIGNQIGRWDTNSDGKLSLREVVLAVYRGDSGVTDPPGRGPGPFENIWSADDTFGGSPANVLPAGGTFAIRLEFQFDPDADNAFQGAVATFKLDLMASQLPQTAS